ncbi:hypothetical protein F4W70_20260 [Pseudomonas cannabina]|nr:hypothetical protein F4W70_20260 [Pseudomonas cannabina]
MGADRATLRLSAKTVVQTIHFRRMHRLLRGQVHSHGLRPESKAGEGRGSGLVRERAGIIAENVSSDIPSSRTSEASPGPLPRPAGRSLKTAFSGLIETCVEH